MPSNVVAVLHDVVMIPRGIPDIGWSDLCYGLVGCLRPGNPTQLQKQIEQRWSSDGNNLACLSICSGFDLFLQAIDLPGGSEVIVSAITIPPMVQILEHHGLIPVPVDVDIDTLSVDPTELELLIGPRTRAILVAHLFGSRMDLKPIAAIAQRHGLLLMEDCAQAYAGSEYLGHPISDVVMFSFGPIKTQTALGGAVLHFRDPTLLSRMGQLHAIPNPPFGTVSSCLCCCDCSHDHRYYSFLYAFVVGVALIMINCFPGISVAFRVGI